MDREDDITRKMNSMTDRKVDILRSIYNRKSDKEISTEFQITESTVRKNYEGFFKAFDIPGLKSEKRPNLNSFFVRNQQTFDNFFENQQVSLTMRSERELLRQLGYSIHMMSPSDRKNVMDFFNSPEEINSQRKNRILHEAWSNFADILSSYLSRKK